MSKSARRRSKDAFSVVIEPSPRSPSLRAAVRVVPIVFVVFACAKGELLDYQPAGPGETGIAGETGSSAGGLSEQAAAGGRTGSGGAVESGSTFGSGGSGEITSGGVPADSTGGGNAGGNSGAGGAPSNGGNGSGGRSRGGAANAAGMQGSGGAAQCPNYPTHDACSMCICTKCASQVAACYSTSDSRKNSECESIEQCAEARHCASTACYCGQNNAACVVAAGPCAAVINAAVGTNPTVAQVNQVSTDPTHPVGRANTLTICTQANCQTVCGLP